MADKADMLRRTKDQFNALFGNMFQFGDSDMELYDRCCSEVFRHGVNFSYMSSTFYAQFAAEILVGALASNPFRRFLVQELTEEAQRKEPGKYWEGSMNERRFGIPDRDYTDDLADITVMMNESYLKIASLNQWYGTPEGQEEFDMYCLSNRAIRDIRRAVCEFPYLIRRFDWDADFAGEIMEYAGIVAAQIRETAGG